MDFTLTTFKKLFNTLIRCGYCFQTFEQFITKPLQRTVVVRHDVDRLPENALRIAEIENKFGITASYYFRVVERFFNVSCIERVAWLGHEVGYHYETMDSSRGDVDRAYDEFRLNLDKLRKSVPVRTACMHGSPLSRFDNRDIWKKYHYKDLGIIAEPYFDVDYTQVFYITDTGRKWNKTGAIIRDTVNSGFDIPINNTPHLISLARHNALPEQIMINVHPQRWHDRLWPWAQELVLQNIKNVVKYFILKKRSQLQIHKRKCG